ncbi:MAG: hypothetical protein HOP29_12865 [Phycisphaerales bacterium]|nr:hypothetical protein [Phycisphaerales bacterium]
MTAEIAVSGRTDSARRILLDVLCSQPDIGPRHWQLTNADSGGTMLLALAASNPQALETSFTLWWAAFQTQLDRANAHSAGRRHQADEIMGTFIAAWRSTRSAPPAAPPATNGERATRPPLSVLDGVHERIDHRVATLVSLRDAESHALAELQSVASQSVADVFLADDAKRAAYATRDDLRQDLDALTMHLTIGQRCILDVWQRSSAPLDDLVAAVERMGGDIGDPGAVPFTSELGDLESSAGNLRKRVGTLSARWTEALSRFSQASIDPFAPQLIDTHARLHDLLAEFNHHASKLLDAMRDALRRLDDASSAQHRDVVSRAKRAFHLLESAARRFEFEASAMDPLNNPRLDGALRSASGLAHRTRKVMVEVDELLLRDELDRRSNHLTELRRTSLDRREALRREIDQVTDALLTSIADYASAVPQAADGLRREFAAAAERDRHAFGDTLMDQFREVVERINAIAGDGEPNLTSSVMHASIVRTPQGVARRFGLAGIASATAFIAVTRWRRRSWADENGT